MGSKPNNVIRIPCKIENLFRYWLEFLAPFHSLTGRETDVAALFLRERWYLSKSILDPNLLNMTLMGDAELKKIREELGLTASHFQVIKNKLKQKKFIVGDQINRRLIPNINEEQGVFQLLLVFEYKDEG